MALGLGSSLVKGGASLLTYVKDNLKLYLDFTSNKSDTLKFPSEGSTSFDSIDDYINVGSNSSVDNIWAGGGTLSAWIYPRSSGEAGFGMIVSKRQSSTGYYVGMNDESGGACDFRFVAYRATSSRIFQTTSREVLINAWNHVLITYDSDVETNVPLMYINGVSVAITGSNFGTGAYDDASNTMYIGGEAGAFTFDGSISNVAVWSRVLEPEEVQSIMNKSYSQLKGVEKTSLVSWWALDSQSDGLVQPATGEELGAEIALDGGFDTDVSAGGSSDNWTLSSTGVIHEISNGRYRYTDSATAIVRLRQGGSDKTLTLNKLHKLTFEIFDNGAWITFITSGETLIANTFYPVGTHSVYFTPTVSHTRFDMKPSSISASFSMDNFSLKEVTSNTGVVTGATTTTSVYGGNAPILPRAVDVAKEGQADAIGNGSASFNGTSDYISLADNDLFSFGNGPNDQAFSISAWINPVDVTGFSIISKGIFNTSGEYLLWINLGNVLSFEIYDESVSSTYELAYYNSSLASYEGSWFHVCATYDGRGGTSANAGIKLYINGENVSTTLAEGGTYVAMENLGADTYIGRYDTYYADGSISQLGIWKGELTQAQIQSVMESTSYSKIPADVKSTLSQRVTNGSFDTDSDWGKGDGWSIDDTNGTASADGTGGFNYLSQSNIFDDANALYKMTITIDSAEDLVHSGIVRNGSVTNFYYGFGITSIGTHTVYFTNTTTGLSVYSNGVTITISNISIEKVTNELVAYYPLDGSSEVKGLSFDGVDDYIDTGTGLGTSLGDGYTGDLTFSFWIKIEQFPVSGNKGIFAFMNPAGNTNSDIVMATTISSSNNLIVRKEGATIVQYITNANTILGTGWNHISIIYKAGSSDDTIFINGTLRSATNSSSFSSSVDLSGKKLDIGRYLEAELESSMSSFAIYNTAKSAEEIKAIYNDGIGGDESSNSGLVGYYKMNNASTVSDLSTNSNDGTVNGATLISAGTTDSVGNNDGGLL